MKCNGLEEYYVIPYQVGYENHNVNVYPQRLKMRVAGIDFEPYRNAFNLIDEFLAS